MEKPGVLYKMTTSNNSTNMITFLVNCSLTGKPFSILVGLTIFTLSHNYHLAANFTFTGYSEDWSLELPATLLCPLYSSMKEKLETAHGPSTEIEKSFSPWKPGDAFSIDDMEIDNGQSR